MPREESTLLRAIHPDVNPATKNPTLIIAILSTRPAPERARTAHGPLVSKARRSRSRGETVTLSSISRLKRVSIVTIA
jgi:hypothetical protein